MAGLVPAIHVLRVVERKTWMPATSVQPGDMADGCSGTWLTHHAGMDSAVMEAIHAVARGVDHGPTA